MNDNKTKYGDDNTSDPIIDNKFFFKIADLLVDPLHNMGVTPNMVTIISTIFTLLTVVFLEYDIKYIAILSFVFGYILDCVDGKIARKYNMGSNLGMTLDYSSDIISNIIILIYIIIKYPFTINNIIILVIFIFSGYMLSIVHMLNEGIASYKKNNDYNFVKYKKKLLQDMKDSDKLYEKTLYNFFITAHTKEYDIYKKKFGDYDYDSLINILPYVKEFGPGTYTVIIAILLYFIK